VTTRAPARPKIGWWSLGLALVRRPGLWSTAARQAARMCPDGWWRTRPFLPVPAADYLAFRLQTMYGGPGDVAPDPADVIRWLKWAKQA
jgi:hypothetical protein